MTGDGLVFLSVGLAWMAVTLVAMQWWHEARTTWLSRLSARGLLSGSYTPAPSSLGGSSLKWLLRQRITMSDLFAMGKLEDLPDEDRVTEVWRVRTVRRFKLFLTVGMGGLLLFAAVLVVYGLLGWEPFLATVVLLGITAVVGGRPLLRRIRAWGDYGADRVA